MTKGDQKKDFLHVSDLIDGIMQIIEKNVEGEINLAHGTTISLMDLITIIKEITGDFPIEHSLPYRPNEIMDYAFDIKKAKTILHWEPKIDLKTGLRELLREN